MKVWYKQNVVYRADRKFIEVYIAENCRNRWSFDKAIAKIKRCSFLPHGKEADVTTRVVVTKYLEQDKAIVCNSIQNDKLTWITVLYKCCCLTQLRPLTTDGPTPVYITIPTNTRQMCKIIVASFWRLKRILKLINIEIVQQYANFAGLIII